MYFNSDSKKEKGKKKQNRKIERLRGYRYHKLGGGRLKLSAPETGVELDPPERRLTRAAMALTCISRAGI